MKFAAQEEVQDKRPVKAVLYRMRDSSNHYALAVACGRQTLWMYEDSVSNYMDSDSIQSYMAANPESDIIRMFYEGDEITLTF